MMSTADSPPADSLGHAAFSSGHNTALFDFQALEPDKSTLQASSVLLAAPTRLVQPALSIGPHQADMCTTEKNQETHVLQDSHQKPTGWGGPGHGQQLPESGQRTGWGMVPACPPRLA